MDWLNGVLQGILGTLIYDLLLAAVVAGLIAWLKSKQSSWASPVLYGLGAFTLVLLISYTLLGHGLLLKPAESITPENSEEHIKRWAEELGLGITKGPKIGDTYFSYVVTLKSGNPIGIMRAVALPGFLQFQSSLFLAPEQQAELRTMTQERVQSVMQELTVQLALSKVGYTMVGIDTTHLMQTIILSKSIPISGNLTEGSFASSLDELDSAVGLVRATLALSIKRNNPHRTMITPHVVQQ